MKVKTRDLICSVLFLAFGIFMFLQSRTIISKVAKDIGSGFMPKIVAGAIIAVSLIKLVLTLFSKSDEREEKGDMDLSGGLWTIALLATYVILFNILGFLVSSALYLFFQMTVLSNEKNRKIGLFLAISIIFPILIYVLFVYIIEMPLPEGILGF
ncbi:MAG: tripartite tricarboxylate transporter TctB family protein [Fusobacteriaceae bacterium]|nr:tripartite tricarboxylate transporter TctB family protein [Fusobacteriaceae bacterium]